MGGHDKGREGRDGETREGGREWECAWDACMHVSPIFGVGE